MIKEYDDLIQNLNKKGRLIIGKEFQLQRYESDGHKLLIFKNVGSGKKAVNRLDGGTNSEVNVCPWFGKFYLYVEVKFVFETKIPKGKRKPQTVVAQCSISISVFKSLTERTIQLFRAE